jgi:hypothetical protein
LLPKPTSGGIVRGASAPDLLVLSANVLPRSAVADAIVTQLVPHPGLAAEVTTCLQNRPKLSETVAHLGVRP